MVSSHILDHFIIALLMNAEQVRAAVMKNAADAAAADELTRVSWTFLTVLPLFMRQEKQTTFLSYRSYLHQLSCSLPPTRYSLWSRTHLAPWQCSASTSQRAAPS